MKRLDVQQLDGFKNTPLDVPAEFEVVTPAGTRVPYETVIGNTPALTSTYDGVNQPQLPLELSSDDTESWDEEAHYPVGRLDSFHGRNLEVLADTVTISDNLGNQYYSLGIKGSNFSNPHLEHRGTASRGVIIHGMQESLVMERVIRASRLLREHGVDTEYICGLVVPNRFPIQTEHDGIVAHEQLLLQQLIERPATQYAQRQAQEQASDETNTTPRSALEVKAGMIETLHDIDYLISYRAMDTPYRLSELSDDDKVEKFYNFVSRNNDDPDVKRYLETLHPEVYIPFELAKNVAKNVARMHKAGITHGFLNALNITALGAIVDLDSCRGEPLGLGDDPITMEDIMVDIYTTVDALHTVLNDRKPEHSPEAVIEEVVLQDARAYAGIIFITEYLRERFDDSEEAAKFMVKLMDINLDSSDELVQHKDILGQFAAGYIAYLDDREKVLSVDMSNLPDFASYDLQLRRNESPLSATPARYIKEIQSKLVGSGWSMNEEYEAFKDASEILHNPIKSTLRALSLRSFIDHARETGFMNDSLAFIRAVDFASSVDAIDSDQPPTSEGERILREYFISQAHAIAARLADPETQENQPVLDFLLNMSLGDLEDQTGHLELEGLDVNVPLLYLNGRQQYQRILTTLGVSVDTPLSYVEGGELMEEVVANPHDTVLLVDYGIAQFVGEMSIGIDVALHLFGHWKNRMPLIVVRGILSGDPHLVVVKNDQYEDTPPSTTTKQLASQNPKALQAPLF